MDFNTLLCVVIPIIAIVAILWVSTSRRKAREQALYEAKYAYETALKKLRENPTNADRRQQALNTGRHYASLSRESRGTTIFDEMALKNDLDAATANASSVAIATTVAPTPAPVPVPVPAPVSTPAQDAPEARLQKLASLKNQGLITEEEYAAQRAKILENI